MPLSGEQGATQTYAGAPTSVSLETEELQRLSLMIGICIHQFLSIMRAEYVYICVCKHAGVSRGYLESNQNMREEPAWITRQSGASQDKVVQVRCSNILFTALDNIPEFY
jgi:hypothetical protein